MKSYQVYSTTKHCKNVQLTLSKEKMYIRNVLQKVFTLYVGKNSGSAIHASGRNFLRD